MVDRADGGRWWDEATDVLRLEEAFKGRPYRDTKGKLTIGYGHNLDAAPISRAAGEFILVEDMRAALAGAMRLVPGFLTLSMNRQIAILCWAFQLGEQSCGGFGVALSHIRAGRWDEAAAAWLQSKWAREDTPARARRMAALLKKG